MPNRHPPRRARLALTALERRLAPATFTVLNAADAGPGSLRQAILNANAVAGADEIAFDPAFFNAANPRTITVLAASGQLTISDPLTINGPGPDIVTVNGGGAVRVFNVEGPGAFDVTIAGLTVTGGNGLSGGPSPTFSSGGGIRISNENLTLDNVVVTGNATADSLDGGGVGMSSYTALVTIRNSTISGNTARRGGGLFLRTDGLLMENSTVAGNVSTTPNGIFGGGGLYVICHLMQTGYAIRNSTIVGNTTGGTGGGLVLTSLSTQARIQNCTITGNTANSPGTVAGEGGGGIAVNTLSSTSLRIESCIVSGNTASAANGRSDIACTGTSVILTFSAVGDPDGFTLSPPSGNNLPFGTALNLRPLAQNGGPTQTVALGVGSPAVNAGSNPLNLTTDQRGPGFPRVEGAAADIGAFEGVVDGPTASGGPYPDVTSPGGTTYTFAVTYAGAAPIDVASLDDADVRITGANGFSQLATFIGVTPAGNGSPRTATYGFTAPGGSFDLADNGAYVIHLLAGQVADTSGTPVTPATLGTFRVHVGLVYTVTNLSDSGAGSLRRAILDANASVGVPDVIRFQPGLAGTIALDATVGQLSITDGVTIDGPGADVITVSGGGAVRVFFIGPVSNRPVTISGLTVTGGNGNSGGPTPSQFDGGGIFVGTGEPVTFSRMVITGNATASDRNGGGIGGFDAPGGAFLVIRDSTISGNTARAGGGINFGNGGGLVLENSTVVDNAASVASGGGIRSYCSSLGVNREYTIRNSTIAGNRAVAAGGGVLLSGKLGTTSIQNSTITGNSVALTSSTSTYGGGGLGVLRTSGGGTVAIASTIISGNTSNNGRDDALTFSASLAVTNSAIGDPDGFQFTGSNNLPFGAALGLGTLADNGGPTRTIAFAPDSPLRNAGSNPANLLFDQRGPGFVRVEGPAADIGAFEYQGTAPRVAGVSVNAGQSNGAQRSRVTSVAVTFDTVVTFAGTVADAFGLARIGGGAVGGFTAMASVVGGVTVVTLTDFAGAETAFGSLVDGRYAVLVRADQVSAGGVQLDGNGDGTGGDDYTLAGSVANGLYRLFGDVNADGVVNAADFGAFRPAFGSSTGQSAYVEWLDFDGDGVVNAFDFGQFRPRFGSGVP